MKFSLPYNFSYVIPNQLAGSGSPGIMHRLEDHLHGLWEKGIRAIVTLTENPLPKVAFPPLERLHIPVEDFNVPTIEQMKMFVHFVHQSLKANKPVLVHCYAGQGRTAVFLACYLVSMGWNALDAISTLKQVRPGSFNTNQQEDFVIEWEAYCKSINL